MIYNLGLQYRQATWSNSAVMSCKIAYCQLPTSTIVYAKNADMESAKWLIAYSVRSRWLALSFKGNCKHLIWLPLLCQTIGNSEGKYKLLHKIQCTIYLIVSANQLIKRAWPVKEERAATESFVPTHTTAGHPLKTRQQGR